MLVPQRPPSLLSSAADFIDRIGHLENQQERASRSARAIGAGWDLPSAIWKQPFSELSGGEQQRIMLATAISRTPAVLLLDEPTASLDDHRVDKVEADLRKETAVWVTHDIAQAERVGDRILEMKTQ